MNKFVKFEFSIYGVFEFSHIHVGLQFSLLHPTNSPVIELSIQTTNHTHTRTWKRFFLRLITDHRASWLLLRNIHTYLLTYHSSVLPTSTAVGSPHNVLQTAPPANNSSALIVNFSFAFSLDVVVVLCRFYDSI